MKKIFVLFGFFMLTLGCKKEEDRVDPVTTCMPSSINQEGSTLIYLYEYDNQNRVTKIRYGNNYAVVYEYSPKFYNYLDFGPSFPSTEDRSSIETVLDSEGRITKYIYKPSQLETRLAYKDGFLSETIHFVKGKQTSTTKYTYTDGNLTSISSTDEKGVVQTGKVEYYPNPNTGRIAEYIFDEELIESSAGRFVLNFMLGNSMKNLPKRLDAEQVIDFTYDFDTKGRVIKLTASDALIANKREVFNFKYDNCK